MKKGFTLLELIIVIIILGLLAGLALPQVFKAVERGRAAEGVQILGILRSAQLRYHAERGTLAANITDLDVDYTSPKFFVPSLESANVANITPETPLASVERNNNNNPAYGNYRLTIYVNGSIICSEGMNEACKRLGY